MAEAAARSLWPEHSFSSAGTNATDGKLAEKKAQRALLPDGLTLVSHRARQLSRDILLNQDKIFVMEKKHLDYIASNFPEFKDKVWLLDGNSEITDPWGKSQDVYNETYHHLLKSMQQHFTNSL